MPLVIEVAAALIRDGGGRYLITQRRRGSHLEGLWEFPGGKRDAGESLEECLRRELREELSATFSVGEKFETIEWTYPDRTIVLHFYRCRLEAGPIEPLEDQAMRWVAPERLHEFGFPPADQALIARLVTERIDAPMPGPISQHITFLDSADLARTAAFYGDVLGLRLARDQGTCRIYHVAGSAYIGFCRRDQASAVSPRGATGVTVLTFITDQVDEWFARLEAAGAEVVQRPTDKPQYRIYNAFVRDPDGYLVEIQRFWEPLE